MFKRILVSISMFVAVATLSGCAVNRSSATLTPGADLGKIKTVYVVKQPKDKQNVDELIKVSLEKRGYVVTKGPELTTPYPADAAVTYIDKWMWDITMYMLELTIQVRDPASSFPIATGNAYHTSLTRLSPTEMVAEVIDEIHKAPKK